eukprot:12915994-Prorocentrum_lima.AAC.1
MGESQITPAGIENAFNQLETRGRAPGRLEDKSFRVMAAATAAALQPRLKDTSAFLDPTEDEVSFPAHHDATTAATQL